MPSEAQVSRSGPQRNNVGLLRLVFALLVVIGHAPEMTDGNRSREPFTVLFGTLSLGDISVDAFFLLSGYLITKSMARSDTFSKFVFRRILRIYPAYIIAYLLSVFTLGTVVGAQPWLHLSETIGRCILLQAPPSYTGQLQGVPHYAVLNGAMWSLAYEFRCYLLVGLLGVTGALDCRRCILAITTSIVLCSIAITFSDIQVWSSRPFTLKGLTLLLGNSALSIRLLSSFLVGACFFLYQKEIDRIISGRLALLSGFAAVVLMYKDPHFSEAAFSVLGGFTLMYVGFKMEIGPLQKINNEYDISYGVYLYGWPIATFIRWLAPAISPWMLAALTVPIALGFGAISWLLVESKFKRWHQLSQKRRADDSKTLLTSASSLISDAAVSR